MTIQHSLAKALQHHQSGRLADARTLYLQILRDRPDEPEILHLLGLIARQMGQLDEAIDLFKRAIALKDDFAEAQNNLGVALRIDGQLENSIAAFGEAIRIQPNFPEAYNNLAHGLIEAKRLDEATAACKEAIRLRPAYVEAYNNLGNALEDKGEFEEAVAAYRRAIHLNPSHAEAHNNLGNVLREIGSIDEAIAFHRRALELRPNYAQAQSNLGNALRAKGQLEEAIAAYRQAIHFKPGYAQAYHNLAVALGEIGRFESAIDAASEAIRLKPDLGPAHNNLGKVLRDSGRLDEAVASFERALQRDANDAEAHNNLGVALKDRGQLDEALCHFERSVAIHPNPAFHSNKIYLLHFHAAYDAAAIAQEQANWDRVHAEPLRADISPHTNDRNPDRRLRIGYIAPYFRKHVVGFNILPLLREHDHEHFEIICYSDWARADALTEQCRSHADGWRVIVSTSDQRVAEMIRADQIDILVDLTQHLASNRLLALARKPAPVQVAFAGYPAGTGLKTIDYRLTDPYLDPPDQADLHDFERPIRLPHSFWCFDEAAMGIGLEEMPKPNRLPACDCGYLTFGCLNNFCKVDVSWERAQVGPLHAWSRILHAVPDSRLLLLAPEGHARQSARDQLANLGVDPNRIDFVSHQRRAQYLQIYHRIDVMLDTFPYGGHTTSLDSLWMGVPVVTLAGKSSIGRAGLSQLTNLGLTEHVAQSPQEYVRIAVELAGNLNRLESMRAQLRDRMRGSPLTNAKEFTRGIESAYRTIWSTWCRKPFTLPESS